MKTLVVYDSYFGNTEKIAQSVAAALNTQALPVAQVPLEQIFGLDLLVIGSLTRGLRPTEAVKDLINQLPTDCLNGVRVAAFDTRLVLELIDSAAVRFIVSKGGYAANPLAKALEKKGGRLVIPPEGFLVNSEKGPLKDGELERATKWGMQIRNAL